MSIYDHTESGWWHFRFHFSSVTETFIYDAITWWQHHGASTNSCGPKLRDWPRRQEFVTPQLQPAPNDWGKSAGYFNVEMFVQHSKQFVQNLSTVPNLFYQIRRFVFHKLNSRGFGGIYRLVYVWFRWYLRCICDIFFESFLKLYFCFKPPVFFELGRNIY